MNDTCVSVMIYPNTKHGKRQRGSTFCDVEYSRPGNARCLLVSLCGGFRRVPPIPRAPAGTREGTVFFASPTGRAPLGYVPCGVPPRTLEATLRVPRARSAMMSTNSASLRHVDGRFLNRAGAGVATDEGAVRARTGRATPSAAGRLRRTLPCPDVEPRLTNHTSSPRPQGDPDRFDARTRARVLTCK